MASDTSGLPWGPTADPSMITPQSDYPSSMASFSANPNTASAVNSAMNTWATPNLRPAISPWQNWGMTTASLLSGLSGDHPESVGQAMTGYATRANSSWDQQNQLPIYAAQLNLHNKAALDQMQNEYQMKLQIAKQQQDAAEKALSGGPGAQAARTPSASAAMPGPASTSMNIPSPGNPPVPIGPNAQGVDPRDRPGANLPMPPVPAASAAPQAASAPQQTSSPQPNQSQNQVIAGLNLNDPGERSLANQLLIQSRPTPHQRWRQRLPICKPAAST